jgi:hypothetical protein
MSKKGIDILGIDHWDHPRGYRGFPVVTFFMTTGIALLKARPDFRPNLVSYSNKHGVGAKEIKISTPEEVFLFGKSKGSTLLQDSGWQLPSSYKKANLRGEVLPRAPAYAIQQTPQIWKIKKNLGICHKGKSSKRRQSKAFKFIKSVSSHIEHSHGISIT